MKKEDVMGVDRIGKKDRNNNLWIVFLIITIFIVLVLIIVLAAYLLLGEEEARMLQVGEYIENASVKDDIVEVNLLEIPDSDKIEEIQFIFYDKDDFSYYR